MREMEQRLGLHRSGCTYGMLKSDLYLTHLESTELPDVRQLAKCRLEPKLEPYLRHQNQGYSSTR